MQVITITYDWNHSLSNKNFKNHKGDVMRRRKTEEINKAWDKLYELVWYKRHILYHGRWHDQYINSGDQTKIDIANKAVAEALDGLPDYKMHCSVLAEEAIRSALEDYEKKQGIQ